MSSRRTRASRFSMADRTTREWFWFIGFPVVLIIGLFIGYRIAVNAIDTILASNDGDVINAQSDPSTPGFRSIVEPAATAGVAFTDGSSLVAAGLLLPAGEAGGTWIILPPEAVGPTGETLAATFARSEAELWSVVETMTAVAVTETVVLDRDATAELVAPVSPVEIELADPLTGPDGPEFGPGTTAIGADDFSQVLGWLNDGESPGNRLTRQQDLITAWFGAMQDAVGQQEDTADGLGSLIAQMARGQVVVEPLPIDGTTLLPDGSEGFAIDADGFRIRVRTLAPFAPPADTVEPPRVLVLNGASNDLGVTTGAARRVGAAGAQVTAIGNGDDFLQEQSVIFYSSATDADAAAELANTVGVERVELDAGMSPAFDLVVVIGKDWADSQ